jgi:N-acetylglucosamine kinase-like BadF-type ATPase
VTRPAILAVDAGGSKADAALLAASGRVLGVGRWLRAVDLGIEFESEVVEPVARAVDLACADAGLDPEGTPLADRGVFCLAGLDMPSDDRRILRQLGERGWAEDNRVFNDSFAVLRAGTDRTWGVAVVCGYGTNCAGVAPDGRTYRLPSFGELSGDWGGGSDLGMAAQYHAIRASDGRGPKTMLTRMVPEHFGLRRPRQLAEAMYSGRLDEDRLAELTPAIFRASREGDEVARSIVGRQAAEIATMACAAIRKLRMTHLDVPVVLGGGVFDNDFPPFFEQIDREIHACAEAATTHVLSKTPPVVGAALLGLDDRGIAPASVKRLRANLTHERLGAHTRRAPGEE